MTITLRKNASLTIFVISPPSFPAGCYCWWPLWKYKFNQQLQISWDVHLHAEFLTECQNNLWISPWWNTHWIVNFCNFLMFEFRLQQNSASPDTLLTRLKQVIFCFYSFIPFKELKILKSHDTKHLPPIGQLYFLHYMKMRLQKPYLIYLTNNFSPRDLLVL